MQRQQATGQQEIDCGLPCACAGERARAGSPRREAGRGERCCDILPGGALPHQTPGGAERMQGKGRRMTGPRPGWCQDSHERYKLTLYSALFASSGLFRSLPEPAKAASLCISQAEQSLQIGNLYRSLNRFSLQSRLSRDIRSVQLSTCRVCCGGCMRAGNLKSDLIVLKDVDDGVLEFPGEAVAGFFPCACMLMLILLNYLFTIRMQSKHRCTIKKSLCSYPSHLRYQSLHSPNYPSAWKVFDCGELQQLF